VQRSVIPNNPTQMEKVTIRACDLPSCPSAEIQGNNVGKIAITIAGFAALALFVNAISKKR
jgi:hypothetical protein